MSSAFTPAEQSKRKYRPPNASLLAAMAAVIPLDKTVMDVGAGTGDYVWKLNDMGYVATGVDGTEDVYGLSGGVVYQVDLTGDCRRFHWGADWAICIEVGEHVPKENESKFMDNVSTMSGEGLIVSWATPGQPGRRHVNCRLPEHVAVEFSKRGWRLDEGATIKARKLADKHYERKVLVFRREQTRQDVPDRR